MQKSLARVLRAAYRRNSFIATPDRSVPAAQPEPSVPATHGAGGAGAAHFVVDSEPFESAASLLDSATSGIETAAAASQHSIDVVNDFNVPDDARLQAGPPHSNSTLHTWRAAAALDAVVAAAYAARRARYHSVLMFVTFVSGLWSRELSASCMCSFMDSVVLSFQIHYALFMIRNVSQHIHKGFLLPEVSYFLLMFTTHLHLLQHES